jgi:hypothetical protein
MPAKPAPAAAPPSSSLPQLTFEGWVQLDSPGLVGWVKTLGLLPDELADAVRTFYNPFPRAVFPLVFSVIFSRIFPSHFSHFLYHISLIFISFFTGRLLRIKPGL